MTAKKTLKIVYIGDDHHNQFEVHDNKPESRKNPVDGTSAHAVAPSSYDRTAINYEITQEDIDIYPELEKVAMAGDIVDEREFNAFVGVEDKELVDIDDKDNKTDEELAQS